MKSVVMNLSHRMILASQVHETSLKKPASERPEAPASQKSKKMRKIEGIKNICAEAILNYSSKNYSSSNIIKMLRVKQEVHSDPRLGLSKEQLLTRLVTVEQEYGNLKTAFETRRNARTKEASSRVFGLTKSLIFQLVDQCGVREEERAYRPDQRI